MSPADRLRVVQAELAATPRWLHGSPKHTALVNEAQRLQERIDRDRAYRRWVVPDDVGLLARFRLQIPR